jgi:hypothetical protein
MSDHSISAYRELSEGVGVTFEAIPPVENAPNILTSVGSRKNCELAV